MKAAIQAMYKHTVMLQAAESITQPGSRNLHAALGKTAITLEDSPTPPPLSPTPLQNQQPVQVMGEFFRTYYCQRASGLCLFLFVCCCFFVSLLFQVH